ncbi:d-beta-hydroxybutyrate dehydrogenase, mitochondrial [Caerostris extrusa]|uniref:D-beta-hydroxybutyrate dehydrogenase, mitochondrial n=1 Tax=Caerostris extrusa TaxID=172846 RepID=A0AAV4UU28_CAEEX|nr:d-beta-hydroxybutyrate dehydrogenase, mitochondrial [Caerostris extrusa]
MLHVDKSIAGRIITVTSINGVITYPGLSVYCATKFGLEGFSNVLRQELGQQHGIRVITIRPGDFARATSIMAQHQRLAQEMWDEMPADQQSEEGELFHRYHENTLKNYGLTSPPSIEGSQLLQDIKEAVLGIKPKDTYLSAAFTHRIVYNIMMTLPRKWTDYVLAKGYKTHA